MHSYRIFIWVWRKVRNFCFYNHCKKERFYCVYKFNALSVFTVYVIKIYLKRQYNNFYVIAVILCTSTIMRKINNNENRYQKKLDRHSLTSRSPKTKTISMKCYYRSISGDHPVHRRTAEHLCSNDVATHSGQVFICVFGERTSAYSAPAAIRCPHTQREINSSLIRCR